MGSNEKKGKIALLGCFPPIKQRLLLFCKRKDFFFVLLFLSHFAWGLHELS